MSIEDMMRGFNLMGVFKGKNGILKVVRKRYIIFKV